MNLREQGAPQEIRDCLAGAVKNLKKHKKETDSEWTKQIKVDLCKLGKTYKLEACASGIGNKAKWGEWLYDLCWAKAVEDAEAGWNLESIPLVVESEWGRTLRHIVADFDKLMLARAELKLMIYQDIPGKKVDEIAKDLVRRVEMFKGLPKADLYLLAGFDNAKMSFVFFEISHGRNGWSRIPVN